MYIVWRCKLFFADLFVDSYSMNHDDYYMLAEFLFLALGVVGYTYDEETLDDFKRYILKSIIILSLSINKI